MPLQNRCGLGSAIDFGWRFCYSYAVALKPIIFSHHAREQLAFRGASEEEITEAIRSVPWQSAELNRLECRKDFVYEKLWQGNSYKNKQVRPIFVEEEDRIVVITVYVYYF